MINSSSAEPRPKTEGHVMIWPASKLFRLVNSAKVVPILLSRLIRTMPKHHRHSIIRAMHNDQLCGVFLIHRSTSFLTFLPRQQLLCSRVTTCPILLYRKQNQFMYMLLRLNPYGGCSGLSYFAASTILFCLAHNELHKERTLT